MWVNQTTFHSLKLHSLAVIRSYHHTISATLLYGLREALAEVCKEGLAETIRRHEDTAAYLQAGAQRMGLELLVQKPEYRMPTVTAIKVPKGIDWKAVIDYAANKYAFSNPSRFPNPPTQCSTNA